MTEPFKPSAWRGRLALAGVAAAAGWLWLVHLPAVARRPDVAERLRRYDALGVNPNGIYWSEIPVVRRRVFAVDDRQTDAPPQP
ncbi:MAG: hypothetical protein ACRC1K_12185 [Planctomycetia bacterium]